ncbi:hypothetical protein EC604_28180 [Paenibacillus amylolyticus]|uniref:Uncharacterized protein n=1 Tax=Paenibacillus amylolyticus TaxID=1451 RepID=A0A5M9X1I0_PAEAM|nr:hypothetical protein EC604_28180 [Paenibacillus amylolyticus]
MDRRGRRGRRHAPAGAWLRRRGGAARAAGQTACAARADRAAAGSACSSRSGSDPRARGGADVAGCPEAQGQPGNQMMHNTAGGDHQIAPAFFVGFSFLFQFPSEAI